MQNNAGDINHEDERVDNTSSAQVQVWDKAARDDATWLYDLVFSTAVDAERHLTQSVADQTSESDDGVGATKQRLSSVSAQDGSASRVVISRLDFPLKQLQALANGSPASSFVVNELLSKWTTLTEDEIEGTVEVAKKLKKPNHSPGSADSRNEDVQMISFTCAMGRKYEFPFHLIHTWAVSIPPVVEVRTEVRGSLSRRSH